MADDDVRDTPDLPSQEGLGIREAQDEVFGLLSEDSEPEEAGTPEEQGVREEDDLPPESEEGDVEAVEAEEEPDEGDDSGEQPDEVEREETDRDSEAELPRTLTVKVDGEEQEVTLDEARDGYMRQAAFTRKTQELAETRREVRGLAQELATERQQYAERLEMAEEVLDALQPERPGADLRRADPEEYAQRLEEFEERQEQIEAVREERQRALEQNEEHLQQAQQERLEQEQEMLVAQIPELLDEDKRADIRTKMVETAQEHYGFSPEELGNVMDHRPLVMLHDAMKYHELKEKGEEVTSSKTTQTEKKTLKPGGSSTSKADKTDQQVSEARKRLARTGSVDDAVETLEAMIGS